MPLPLKYQWAMEEWKAATELAVENGSSHNTTHTANKGKLAVSLLIKLDDHLYENGYAHDFFMSQLIDEWRKENE